MKFAPDYSNYEELGRFNAAQLSSYRASLLKKTKHQVDFIRNHVGVYPLSVLEIGSGNGRLLVSLAQHHILNWYTGVELSKSRVKFAEDWAFMHEKISAMKAEFIVGDVLGQNNYGSQSVVDMLRDDYDLAVCITGCFQYFNSGEEEAVALIMANRAKFGLFELYKPPVNNRNWHKLPTSDPFDYLLDDYDWKTYGGDPVVHTKTFIKKKGTVDEKVEYLRYYTMGKFLRLLRQQAGYKDILWAAEDSEKMVILVRA